MLNGVPKIISPELLKILMEMGHGDEIVIADGNFPAASHAARLVRADGHGSVELLDAILKLFPLDTYVEHPALIMQRAPGDNVPTPIWTKFETLLRQHTAHRDPIEYMERMAFYDRTRFAYAILATGESALYANIILKKGVIKEI